MRLEDSVTARGVLEVRLLHRGCAVEVYRDANMIVNLARNVFAQLLGGDGVGKAVTQIGFGTDGNGPSLDDTALTEAYLKDVASHDYPQDGHVRFSWTLAASEANGTAIREFGLLSADGTLIARKTRGAIEKSDDISLEGTWTIIF